MFLLKDERNFHVWNYRLQLIQLELDIYSDDFYKLESIIKKELEFVKTKIKMNFSNYSALHFFTKFIEIQK